MPVIPPVPNWPRDNNDEDHVEPPLPLHQNEHVNYHTFDARRGSDPSTDVEDHEYQGDEESQHVVDGASVNGSRAFSGRQVHWEERVSVVVLLIVALPLLLAALYICLDLFLLRRGIGSGKPGGSHR